MTTGSALWDAVAAQLDGAWRDRRPIPQISATHPALDVTDAYAIQQRVVAARIGAGETIVGWKLGLTSRAMQQQLGVDQPDYGPILVAGSSRGGSVRRDRA